MKISDKRYQTQLERQSKGFLRRRAPKTARTGMRLTDLGDPTIEICKRRKEAATRFSTKYLPGGDNNLWI
jgi:hypothetical protein